MRLFSFLLLLFTFCSKTNKAQISQFGKYSVSFQPLQLLCRDLPITFERILNRGTFGFTLGYRFDSKADVNPAGIVRYWVGSDFEFTSPRYKGVTLGINSKYSLGKERIYYVEGQLFYRHWWFKDRYYRTTFSGGDNYNYITSEESNVLGLKLLLGMKKTLKKKGKVRPFLCGFFGIGYRIKTKNEVGLSGITNYSIQTPRYFPYKEESTKNLPSVHVGINLGVEIFKSNKSAQ
ncbi:MAG: hypothetical protein V4561_14225 [Bacteroidota bacterium]